MTVNSEPNLFAGPDQSEPPAVAYATVAPEQGIDTTGGGLTYGIPPWLSDLAVGERVVVPLGKANKPVAGYVIERFEQCPLEPEKRNAVKAIKKRDERAIHLPADLIAMARWIAGYYCCPLGMVFASMLPAAVKRGTGVIRQTLVKAAPSGAGNNSQPVNQSNANQKTTAQPKLSKLQRAVLDQAQQIAEAGNPWLEMKALADRAGAKSVSPVKQLIEKGMLVSKQWERVVSELDTVAEQKISESERLDLSQDQHDALSHLLGHLDEGFSVHLLHGVTGSGKTEVYLRVLEQALSGFDAVSDKAELRTDDAPGDEATPGFDDDDPAPASAIVLVPEIALTPQTVARFLARFERVAVLHSGLTAAQRHAQWRRIRRGEANIVVGARSAVFAPVQNLKMIIVDEEHESSYKQDQAPRYHGRDVAVKRAQLWNVPVVLGSATPSLESYYNAGGRMRDPEAANNEGGDNKSAESVADGPATQTAAGRSHYYLVRMPERVAGMAMPTVELVDMQEERRERRGLHMMSQSLERQLTAALDPHQPGGAGQAILLLNRRGYANYIACPDHNCGWMLRCEHCDAAMVYHRETHLPAGGVVRCHHCTAEQRLPKVCPVCEKRVTVFGHGTQRVEEELQRKFPNLTYLRMDSDTMRRSRDYEDTLARFREGEVDVLLGTQMIAKGLDFAGVRLVGVISGDTSLHVPDFRASERTFQLISQVSGRAGRSDRPGRVIVQTFSPDDPAITAAANHDYDGFAARELYLRYEMSLPPIQRMARLVVRDMDHQACLTRAQTIADQLRTENERLDVSVDLHGPVPCPLARLADYYRYQVEMTASTAGALQSLLTALRNARSLVSDMHTAVDVDPVSLL